ncbi:MAG: decarboxylase, partial [Pseudomonadota bacterium]|nr:decarboxylase [Pseudomonadota bacterium]
MNIFQNLISSIKGGALRNRYFRTKDLDNLPQDINEAVESVMSKSGEVSALVYAENLFNLIEVLNDKQFI